MVEQVFGFTLSNHTFFDVTTLCDSVRENSLPGIKFESLDVFKSLVNLVGTSIFSLTDFLPGSRAPFSSFNVDSHLKANEEERTEASISYEAV